jgi:hypothetical protein
MEMSGNFALPAPLQTSFKIRKHGLTAKRSTNGKETMNAQTENDDWKIVNIAEMPLGEVEHALSDLEKINKEMGRNFSFKQQGIRMTAFEFFKIKKDLKGKISALKKRRREILNLPKGKANGKF